MKQIMFVLTLLLATNGHADHMYSLLTYDLVTVNGDTMEFAAHLSCTRRGAPAGRPPEHVHIQGQAPSNGSVSRDFFVYKVAQLATQLLDPHNNGEIQRCTDLVEPNSKPLIILTIDISEKGYHAVIKDDGAIEYNHNGLWEQAAH